MARPLFARLSQAALAASSLTALATAGAMAQDAASLEDLRALVAQQQEQIDALEAKQNDTTVSSLPFGFKNDNGASMSLHGRAITDAGFVMDDIQDRADSTRMRAVWFGLKGQAGADWSYLLLLNLNSGSQNVQDGFLKYTGFDNVELTVGYFRPHSGISNMTGMPNNLLMERSSSTTVFRSLRNIGVDATVFGERWGWHTGLYGEPTTTTADDDEGWQLSSRVHAAPIFDKDAHHYLHLGVNADFRTETAGTKSARFRARGDSLVLDDFLIDTGTIENVDNQMLYGVEARYVRGPFSLASEYKTNTVVRSVGDDLNFGSGYAAATLTLTGESRGYNAKNGSFGGIKPNQPLGEGGLGAFELVAQYTTVSLDDGDVLGGELTTYGVGANWYPTRYVKFAANYLSNETNENAPVANDSPGYVTLRAQINF